MARFHKPNMLEGITCHAIIMFCLYTRDMGIFTRLQLRSSLKKIAFGLGVLLIDRGACVGTQNGASVPWHMSCVIQLEQLDARRERRFSFVALIPNSE